MRVLTVFLIVAAVAASIGVGVQWRALQEAKSEAAALTAESAATAAQPQEEGTSPEELERLREETRDLLKLRSQVGQLRAQIPALAKARSENARLMEAQQSVGAPRAEATPPPAEGFVAREALAEAGLATPEAVVQTFFRAMRDGDVARFAQCVTPESRRRERLDRISSEQLRAEKFHDFKIVERKDVSPERVVLGLQSSASASVLHMTLRKFGNEWLIEKPW